MTRMKWALLHDFRNSIYFLNNANEIAFGAIQKYIMLEKKKTKIQIIRLFAGFINSGILTELLF